MKMRAVHRLVRAASAAAIALALAACTQGGQFDPTEVLSADVFGTKKKLQGEREPLFPNGVPGAESGVPRDLVKGYQAPPAEQATAENADTSAKPPPQAAEAKPKPKPKARPKVAHAPAAARAGQDAVWGQSSAAPSQPQRRDPAWDQKSASPQQSAWPASQSAAPAPQTAQPTQSIWPNPQAPNTYSR